MLDPAIIELLRHKTIRLGQIFPVKTERLAVLDEITVQMLRQIALYIEQRAEIYRADSEISDLARKLTE